MLSCTESPSLPAPSQKLYLKVLCPNIGWRTKHDSIDSEYIKDCGKIWVSREKGTEKLVFGDKYLSETKLKYTFKEISLNFNLQFLY